MNVLIKTTPVEKWSKIRYLLIKCYSVYQVCSDCKGSIQYEAKKTKQKHRTYTSPEHKTTERNENDKNDTLRNDRNNMANQENQAETKRKSVAKMKEIV